MEETKRIKVLVVEPLKAPYVKVIPNTLSALQSEVGEYIQTFYPLYGDKGMEIICNEEGKNNGLPLNRTFCDNSGNIYEIIAGTFLVVGLSESNFCSLTNAQVEKYLRRFQKPEFFLIYPDRIVVLPGKSVCATNRKLEIYQLKNDDSVSQKMQFLPFSCMLKYHYSVKSERYDLVYSGTLSPNETLDQIYARFNSCLRYFPDGYKGHSLSVSDIIVIYENNERNTYFVDSVHFLRIDDFFS